MEDDPMRKALAAALATALVSGVSPLAAQETAGPYVYQPTKENLDAREWFQDAKFGVFLHWGLYSQLGGVGTTNVAEWIMEDLKIPTKKYERLAQFFNPTQFDAEEWVKSYKRRGGFIHCNYCEAP